MISFNYVEFTSYIVCDGKHFGGIYIGYAYLIAMLYLMMCDIVYYIRNLSFH